MSNVTYKSIFSMILLFTLLFTNMNIVSAEQWLYVNPVKPKQTISIERNPDSFGVNDVHHDANFCGEKDDYICVTTEGFQFYVPRNISDEVKGWESGENIYSSRRLKRVNILGLNEPIYHIQRKEGDGVTVFLYSQKRGLIGMGGFKANSMGFYILSQSCGFGSNKYCKNMQ